MEKLDLSGNGAAYLRVSDDRQDEATQRTATGDFLDYHKKKIAPEHWYVDHGWQRDEDRKRPDFQRLLANVRRGRTQWVVIPVLDRLSSNKARRTLRILDELDEVGCRVYDTSGRDLLADDIGNSVVTLIDAITAAEEPKKISRRALSGMVDGAKDGEAQGGVPGLGLDRGVFDRASGEELWRFVYEGREVAGEVERRGKMRPVYRILRRKVYPDDTSERADGNINFRTNEDTQVLRLTPSNDPDKVAAVRTMFRRYATESIHFAQLAKWLNGQGMRTAFGGHFQHSDVERMLRDENYLDRPVWGKVNVGKYHRHDASAPGAKIVPRAEGDFKKLHRNAGADI